MKLLISLMLLSLVALLYNLIIKVMFGHSSKRGEIRQTFAVLNDITVKKNRDVRISKSLSRKQYFKLFVPIGLIVFIMSNIFFRSMASAVTLTFLSSGLPYIISKNRKKQYKKLLNYQFREALRALSTSIKAGSSLRNGLVKTHEDLNRIYLADAKEPILIEFETIVYELDLMLPIEDVLINFKNRAELEDVSDFVNVTLMTNKQGGDLIKVIECVSSIISDRIEIEHEINTLVSGKRSEAKLLTILPICMVLILSIVSPKYMAPMYESLVGRLLMIFATILLVINYFVGKKIIDIEV